MKAPKELRKFIVSVIRWHKRLGILKKSGSVWWDSPEYERKFANSKKNYRRSREKHRARQNR